jgi:hypothetical protein
MAIGVSSPIDPTASFASSTIGCRISSRSSMVMFMATWRRRSSSRGIDAPVSSPPARISPSITLIRLVQSWYGCFEASTCLISRSWYSRPSTKSTASIWPGPSRPRSMMRLSSSRTIPASDPAISSPSLVMV